jgi:hypothetical protein
MQASEAQEPCKATLQTSIKCAIPVGVLAVLAFYFYCAPENLVLIYQAILPIVLPALVWIGVVFIWVCAAVASFVKFTGCLLDVITIALCCVYLWHCCVLNHLKHKKLTDGLYKRLSTAWKVLSITIMILFYVHCFNMTALMTSGHEGDYFLRSLSTLFGILVFGGFSIYTDANNQLFTKGKK